MALNVFTGTARLGADAEQRFTQDGTSIVSFNAAIDSGYGDKKVTTWIRFSLFGKRGESVLPYLTKGIKVGVSGELTNRKWQDEEGQDRYSLEVRLNELDLPEKSNSANTPAQKAPDSANSHKPKPQFDDLGDDCPF